MSPDPIFVIQHHLATADHYDLRLQIEGVLVSWAVPRGPSMDPRRHRLAIRTDDHDLAHADVEGTTGPGPRGIGVVQLWDRGTYVNQSHRGEESVDAATGLARGRLTVRLAGVKVWGAFSLVRTDRAARESWLLIKKADADADPAYVPTLTENLSVATGRTLDEIAAEALQ